MDSIWGNIFKPFKKEDDDEIRTILKKIPVFKDLDNRELARVERILHRRTYHPSEIIFSQGDPGFGMYIIESGIVSIVLMPSEHRLAELSEGEFFGELTLLDESPRTASAISRTACKMLCFFQPDLFDLINRDPRLGVKIMFGLARTIGARLKYTNECINALKDLPAVSGAS
ncbi:MAG: cyclic nucleotide-binding domain-containing protein [Nitrospirae bacterium]|nr:cyclic nucleotide-binding domain-containing protein [Nitrospirota bacterium]